MVRLFLRTVLLFITALPSLAAAQGQRDFHAVMAAEWETKYTESPGVGTADFHLDLSNLKFTWTITFKDLSGPLETLAVYGPAQPGANGAKFLELATKGATSPVRGSAAITEAQVQYLLYGWTYVNLTTGKFPWGEIRGQLDVRPPEGTSK
ncbi:MAG: CHRD domain-containing protein [Rhodospirillaceae bacterium]|nr:CHRD domain-containing protein [Rhodospirillaceae bacterium]